MHSIFLRVHRERVRHSSPLPDEEGHFDRLSLSLLSSLGTVVTALFSRGPWLYVRIDSSGQTGYIPRIICSLHHQRAPMRIHPVVGSTTAMKVEGIDVRQPSLKNDNYYLNPYKQQINRYLSHSSAIIHDQQQRRVIPMTFDERDRRNTYTLPRPPRSSLGSSKDRRLTSSSLTGPLLVGKHESLGPVHPGSIPARDTDSSSTQDSGYSESIPYFLVQQADDAPPIARPKVR